MWPFAVRKSSGYGAHSPLVDGAKRNVDAHRYVCERAYGAAPTAQHQAAHSCGMKLCVNPRHLRWALPLDNMADAIAAGTLRGGGRYRQRLFAAQVEYIKGCGKSLIQLGVELGMEPAHIGRVRRRAA